MPIRTYVGDTCVLDIEIFIERKVREAAEAARSGDRCLWRAGMIAMEIVGKYQVNATKDIALLAGRSASTVENWAHAWMLYKDLQVAGYVAEARYFRKLFTPTHFWTMFDLRNRYKLSPDKVMGYFAVLLTHKQNGLPHGASALEREVEAGEKRDGNTPTWSTLRKSFHRHFVGLLVAQDLPEDVREWLNGAPDSVKEFPE